MSPILQPIPLEVTRTVRPLREVAMTKKVCELPAFSVHTVLDRIRVRHGQDTHDVANIRVPVENASFRAPLRPEKTEVTRAGRTCRSRG